MNNIISAYKNACGGLILLIVLTCSGCNDTVYVDVNGPPIAQAGDDTVIWRGQEFTLDASGSQPFSSRDSLTYSWSFLEIPEESIAVITKQKEREALFTPDINGLYVVHLLVTGPNNLLAMDTVNITATACMVDEISVSDYTLLYDEDFNSLPITNWRYTTFNSNFYPNLEESKIFIEDGTMVLSSGYNYCFARAELDLSNLNLVVKEALIVLIEIEYVYFPFYYDSNGGSSLYRYDADDITLSLMGKNITLRPVKKVLKPTGYDYDRPIQLFNVTAKYLITTREVFTDQQNPWCSNIDVTLISHPTENGWLSLEAKPTFNDSGIGSDYPNELRIARIIIWGK